MSEIFSSCINYVTLYLYIYIKTLQSKSIYNIIKGKKIHDTHTHTHTHIAHTYAIIHAKKEVN